MPSKSAKPSQDQRQSGKRKVLRAALPPSRTVLLLVDFINPLDFDGAADLTEPAIAAARRAALLKRRLAGEGVRAIYVNDNFGHWHSDFDGLTAHCRRRGGPAAALVRSLAPRKDDLRVLKPRHSGFHGTPLDLLLTQLDARQLVLVGLAADLCVQFTAMDAFVRGFRLWVPEDCVAAESPERTEAALSWMRLALKAKTNPSVAAKR